MALYDDEDPIGLLDDEKEKQWKGVPYRSVTDEEPPAPSSTTEAQPSTTETKPAAKPVESVAGPAPVAPPPAVSVTAGPLDQLGPAAQREQELLKQGPPQYHGLKKVFDVLGASTTPGQAIERGAGIGTLGYQSRLGQAEKAAQLEQAQAKRPLDLSAEQAKTEQQQSLAVQEKAKAAALLQPKPGAGSKIAFHYSTDDGKTLAVFEDGTTKELPAAQQKEVQDKYPGLTADELAMFPPPKRDDFSDPVKYQEAQKAWGKEVSDFKQTQKLQAAEAGANMRGQSYGRNRPISVLDTWNGNRPVTVSAGEAMDNPDRYLTQAGGGPALTKTALIEDIRGAIANAHTALDHMGDEGFTKSQRAMLAAGLSAPEGQAGQYLESLLREDLTEAQHDYIIALFQLRENAMAMRSVLGAGQGAEDLRTAITQTLPGAGTPTKQYAKKQLDAFEGQLNRLSRGVPTVPLRAEAPVRGNTQAPEKTYTQADVDAAAKQYKMTPAQIEAGFKKKGYEKKGEKKK